MERIFTFSLENHPSTTYTVTPPLILLPVDDFLSPPFYSPFSNNKIKAPVSLTNTKVPSQLSSSPIPPPLEPA